MLKHVTNDSNKPLDSSYRLNIFNSTLRTKYRYEPNIATKLFI